jgi:hypothetical protein
VIHAYDSTPLDQPAGVAVKKENVTSKRSTHPGIVVGVDGSSGSKPESTDGLRVGRASYL